MSKAWWIAMATLVVFAALAVVAPRAALADKEEKIPVDKLPKAIVAIVNALVPEGEILEAEKETETEDGKTEIEIEVKVKTKEGKTVEVEFTMAEDGKTIKKVEIEEEDDDDDEHEHEDDDDKKGDF